MNEEPTTGKSSPLAVSAAVAGLVAFIFGPAGIMAIMLGHVALFRIKHSNGVLAGRGLCIFALVMGYLAIVVMILRAGR